MNAPLDMLIHIWIETTRPLAGRAATSGGDPLRFDGWLELLTVVSRLVAAASGGDVEATDMPVQGTEPAAEKHHQREG